MKRVLVIGADGILGSEITRKLEQYSDIEQICYDIRQILYKRSNGTNIRADICDQKILQQALDGRQDIHII